MHKDIDEKKAIAEKKLQALKKDSYDGINTFFGREWLYGVWLPKWSDCFTLLIDPGKADKSIPLESIRAFNRMIGNIICSGTCFPLSPSNRKGKLQ